VIESSRPPALPFQSPAIVGTTTGFGDGATT
jgi:hypothetical protein